MKKVTSVTVFDDAIGKRMSATWSEIDETTGKITSDNNRIDRVITDKTALSHADTLREYAERFIGEM